MRWRNGSDDFVALRGYLDSQKAAFAVVHDVEGYAHALGECLGVIAGSLLGMKLSSSLQCHAVVLTA
jgi:hypothetical protein